MLALSLYQPWASAVILLGKDVENRRWAPPARVIGQRIAIHAGRRVDQAALADARAADVPLPEPLPTGALVGTVRLAEAHHATSCGCSCSTWADPGAHHWLLADPRPLTHPVACRGFQRLWTVPTDLIGGIR